MGMLLVLLVFAESVLGILSADSRYLGFLVVHIVLGTGLVAAAVLSLLVANRLRSPWARFATCFTTLSIASAAITGAIFLLADFAQAAIVDRGFALASLMGACSMIALGSVKEQIRKSVPTERVE